MAHIFLSFRSLLHVLCPCKYGNLHCHPESLEIQQLKLHYQLLYTVIVKRQFIFGWWAHFFCLRRNTFGFTHDHTQTHRDKHAFSLFLILIFLFKWERCTDFWIWTLSKKITHKRLVIWSFLEKERLRSILHTQW